MVDYTMAFDNGAYRVVAECQDSLLSNIMLSICVKRGSLFSFPEFGSRLHEIGKITDGNLRLARDYTVEALQWLITVGRAAAVQVEAQRDPKDPSRINLYGSVTKSSGDVVPFTVYYPVI